MNAARALTILLGLSAALKAAPPASPVWLDPPPGWIDVTAKTTAKGLILAYQGPEGSSFALARMPAVPLDNPAAVRSYLVHVLAGLRAGSKRDYRVAGRLETRPLRNGISAQILRAELAGKPRLILAVFDGGGGRPVLSTLSSAAPEQMLTPLLGSVRLGKAGEVRSEGTARSADGQLELALGGGLRSREALPDEKSHGLVLAVQGSGAEVRLFKLSEDDVQPREQIAVVRATVADALKISVADVSPALEAATSAGPTAVYAWAKVPGSSDLRFAAGFLPWGYWGYSILAQGPMADELLVGAMAALKQGPSAVSGLVAASPRVEVEPGSSHKLLKRAFALGVLLVLAAFVWSRGRKNANLPR